jgi:hypothetical protein
MNRAGAQGDTLLPRFRLGRHRQCVPQVDVRESPAIEDPPGGVAPSSDW